MASKQAKRRFAGLAIHLLYVVVRAVLRFLGRAVGFLAASAQTAPANDALNSAIRGGLLNYRTGKFDDGNDPGGIYYPD